MRTSLLASVALATAPIAIVALAAPVSAQSKLGIAVVNVETAIGTSAAAQTAGQQMQVTYKGSLDTLNSRQAALQTEVKAKEDALKAAVTAAGAKPTPVQQTALQTQYDALQRRVQEAQNELQQLQQPLQLARAYVVEQISTKLEEALKNVMTKNKVDLLVKEGSVEAYQPSVDLTASLVTELNTLVPSVGIVPPTGWRPGQQGAAAAAPGAVAPVPAPAAGTPPKPAPAKPAPTGR